MMRTNNNLKREKRKRVRTSFMTEVVIKSSQDNIINGYMNNISIDGMFVDSVQPVAPGCACIADIILTGRFSTITLSTKGSVVRKATSGFAVKFDKDLEWWSLFTIFSSYGKPSDNFIPASFFDELIAEAA